MVEWTKENLIGKLELSSFVIDYMLVSETPHLGPFTNLKVYIVEVNPFAEFAGAGLFSWTEDDDILYGDAPFEFRVANKPKKDAIQLISPEWASYMQKAEQILGATVL